MANVILNCGCGQRLAVAEQHRGKRIKCPKCQSVLTVPQDGQAGADPPPPPAHYQAGSPTAPPPPPVPPPAPGRRREEEYDRPPTRSRWDDRDRDDYDDGSYGEFSGLERAQMETVRLGLGFQYWRFLLSNIVIVLYVILMLASIFMGALWFGMGPRNRDAAEAFGVMAILVSILVFVMALGILVCQFVGGGMCCKVPARSGGKGIQVTALILDCVGLAFLLLFLLLVIIANSMRGRGDEMAVFAFIVYAVGALCLYVGMILFMVFLNRLAHYVGDTASAGRAMGSMISFLVLTIGGTLIFIGLAFVLGMMVRGRDPWPIFLLGFLGILYIAGLLIIFFMIMSVISRLRDRIYERTAGPRY